LNDGLILFEIINDKFIQYADIKYFIDVSLYIVVHDFSHNVYVNDSSLMCRYIIIDNLLDVRLVDEQIKVCLEIIADHFIQYLLVDDSGLIYRNVVIDNVVKRRV